MKKVLIILLLIPSLLCAQDFTWRQEFDSIQVQIEEYVLPVPWTGGYSYSCPELCDIDGDCDFDMFIGHSYKNIAFYENYGTSAIPEFSLTEEYFSGILLSEGDRTQPVFWDMDSDGDLDLFIGNMGEVYITVYENTGSITQHEFVLVADSLFDVYGEWLPCIRPAFWDYDLDGDEDLFCGEHTGEIWLYENIGDSTTYSFELVTHQFADIDVGMTASPTFIDIDADGDQDLFIGEEFGKIWYYHNIGDSANYDFIYVTDEWLGIDLGENASPEFCDIDDDGDYDLFLGKDNSGSAPLPPGAIHFWENIGDPQNPDFIEVNQNYLTLDVGGSAKPSLCDINSDGLTDLIITTADYMSVWQNTGTLADPSFSLRNWNLLGGLPPGSVDFGDFDNDGDPDILTVSGWTGYFTYWENRSREDSLIFVEISSFDVPYIVYKQTLGDLDDDGDLDLLIGATDPLGTDEEFLCYYENVYGPGIPLFSLVTEHWGDITWNTSPVPDLLDFDFDGDLDLWMTDVSVPDICYWENVGSPTNPVMDFITDSLLSVELYETIKVDGADIDADGDTDVFATGWSGGCRFFRNVTEDTSMVFPPLIQHPLHGIEMTFGPNPANPVGIARFSLPYASYVNLGVYDITGRLVKPLASDFLRPGPHQFRWNIDHAASGVYFLRLQTNSATLTKKVIVLK